MNDKSEMASCAPIAHSGEYSLDCNEELVVISYPGLPRGQLIGGARAAHQFRLPDLLPIVTVANETGNVDVVIETFPHEH